MSHHKLNLMAQLVRGLRVSEAEAQLGILQKRSARYVEKALKAAVANGAQNFGLDQSRMVVGLAFVGRGTPLPRIDYRARGKSGRKHRGRSHLTARRAVPARHPLCPHCAPSLRASLRVLFSALSLHSVVIFRPEYPSGRFLSRSPISNPTM